MGTGLASGILAGYAKEYIWDKEMGRGTFSKNDLMCTAWGSMLGTIGLVVSFDIKEKRKRKHITEIYERY